MYFDCEQQTRGWTQKEDEQWKKNPAETGEKKKIDYTRPTYSFICPIPFFCRLAKIHAINLLWKAE